MENQPCLDMLWRACFRWGIRPDQVTGDTTYGTVENIVGVEEQNVRAYVPLPDFDQRTPFYGASKFTYDPERDEFRCPEGQLLRRKTAKYTEGVVVYQAEAATCNACPLKAACTESSQGRQVQRSASTMPSIWIGSAPTTRRPPTRRRWPSERSGSSRSLGKPRTGTA